MEIAKNTTELNKKTLTAFQNQEIFKKSWIVGVCGILLAILSFSVVEGQIVLRSIPFLVIGLAVYPLYVILLKVLFIKQNKTFQTTVLDYTFTENKILISGKSAETTEQTEMPYTQLEKIRITKKYIFLYINKISALVVDKNTFTSGSAEKLINLIKLRFGEKLPPLQKKVKEEKKKEENK